MGDPSNPLKRISYRPAGRQAGTCLFCVRTKDIPLNVSRTTRTKLPVLQSIVGWSAALHAWTVRLRPFYALTFIPSRASEGYRYAPPPVPLRNGALMPPCAPSFPHSSPERDGSVRPHPTTPPATTKRGRRRSSRVTASPASFFRFVAIVP